ncbi:MAG: hypothetical protein IPI67_06210 [Myxococcales bacterium]|nr:hypothetical protein [Myxococcales bacterium]
MSAELRRTLALFWHIHQPFFVPDSEVREQVVESYLPLLELHERLKIPFSLNVSGALLTRLPQLGPEFVERLVAAVDSGLCEVVGSGAFHPLLPLLTPERARAQVRFDVEAKQRILGRAPRGFWPADLGWSHFLVPILAELGIEWTVLDGAARVMGSVLPAWQPEERHGQKVLSPRLSPLLHESELGRVDALRVGENRVLSIARHPGLTWKLVDLDEGALHRPDEVESYGRAVEQYFASGASLLVLGDDGERINGRTRLTYERVLRALVERVDRVVQGSAAVEERAALAEERYLPTSTFLVDFSAWLNTPDDFVCFRLLETFTRELALRETLARHSGDAALQSALSAISSELLPLEDSGFYFWRYLRRTREPFVAKLELLSRRLREL